MLRRVLGAGRANRPLALAVSVCPKLACIKYRIKDNLLPPSSLVFSYRVSVFLPAAAIEQFYP